MIYSKLPVVFLSTLASQKKDSTNATIAKYLLENIDKMQNIGITDLAKGAHVANSSISRFCKEIGLNDFNELKELLIESNFYYESSQDYLSTIQESFQMVHNSIDYKQILKLCRDIQNYNKVAVFGLLKGQGVAISLQTDLLMQGKFVYTNLSYNEQLDYILNATSQDLIIIFSYTGSFFEYHQFRAQKKKLYAPKIWMIAGNQKEYPDYINEYILFDSKLNQVSHPYQLQYVENIIAQTYNQLIMQDSNEDSH